MNNYCHKCGAKLSNLDHKCSNCDNEVKKVETKSNKQISNNLRIGILLFLFFFSYAVFTIYFDTNGIYIALFILAIMVILLLCSKIFPKDKKLFENIFYVTIVILFIVLIFLSLALLVHIDEYF